jgi:hypothetical protein
MAYCTLETSKGLDRILEDMSATRGIPRVSGIKGNSTPATKDKVPLKGIFSGNKHLSV